MSRYELIQMGVLKDDRGRRSTCHLTMGPFVLLGSAKESTEAGQNAMFVLSRQQTIFIIEPYVRMHLLNEESMKTMTRKFVVHR